MGRCRAVLSGGSFLTVCLAVCLAVCLLLMPGGAPSAEASTGSTTLAGALVRHCPDPWDSVCRSFAAVAPGVRVRPVCRMPGARGEPWLLVGLPTGEEGFVRSALVDGPPVGLRCAGVARVQAGLAALDRIGEVYARPSDAALFGDWGTIRGEWSGDCKKLVSASYRAAGLTLASGDARPAFAHHLVSAIATGSDRTPPFGAIVGYDVARPYGHVAIAVGGDRIVTTLGGEGSRTAVGTSTTSIYGNYLGWLVPRGI